MGENALAFAPNFRHEVPFMKFRVIFCCLFALCFWALSGCRRPPAAPPFDVPALIGLPMEQVEAKLGKSATLPNNQKSWAKNGATLTATFKPNNGRVTELTLIDASETVRDGEQQTLLKAGKLAPSDARYSTDYIEAPDRPLYYNGVRIVPAPRTYQVQLRLSGPPQLLQVGYAMSGANPPGEEFLTLAPWDVSATLADNAQIQFGARLAQSQMPANSPIVVEILVDGKVVASKKASIVANCSYEL